MSLQYQLKLQEIIVMERVYEWLLWSECAQVESTLHISKYAPFKKK
jgi:hypothetical protein